MEALGAVFAPQILLEAGVDQGRRLLSRPTATVHGLGSSLCCTWQSIHFPPPPHDRTSTLDLVIRLRTSLSRLSRQKEDNASDRRSSWSLAANCFVSSLQRARIRSTRRASGTSKPLLCPRIASTRTLSARAPIYKQQLRRAVALHSCTHRSVYTPRGCAARIVCACFLEYLPPQAGLQSSQLSQ